MLIIFQVEITLNTYFEKFVKNPQFLSILWKAFENLADLKENCKTTKEDKERLLGLRRRLNDKYHFEFEEKEESAVKRINYCKIIEEKMIDIKLNVLEYVDKLQEIMFEVIVINDNKEEI